jgi:hypothetical protein
MRGGNSPRAFLFYPFGRPHVIPAQAVPAMIHVRLDREALPVLHKVLFKFR